MPQHKPESSQYTHLKQIAFETLLERDKKELRQSLKAQRKNQDPRIATYKSNKISETVLKSDALARVNTIAAYYPVQGEVDTLSIIHALIEQGKKVALPGVAGQDMRFFAMKNLETDLIKDQRFGIHEPNPDTCAVLQPHDIDLFLTPGIGFDIFGSRIGFGGGFYDRFFSIKREDALAFGLAYDFQLVHTLQTEPHDHQLNGVFTEHQIYQPQCSDFITNSDDQTRALAISLMNQLKGQNSVIALHGDLGTGKTVFVNGLATALNSVEPTASPTFIYCREYHGDQMLYHIDGYRIDSVTESDTAFWAELFENEGVIAIEWAERFTRLVPKEAIHLFGGIQQDGSRKWTLFTPLAQHRPLHGAISC